MKEPLRMYRSSIYIHYARLAASRMLTFFFFPCIYASLDGCSCVYVTETTDTHKDRSSGLALNAQTEIIRIEKFVSWWHRLSSNMQIILACFCYISMMTMLFISTVEPCMHEK
jgi:hypothetical protein